MKNKIVQVGLSPEIYALLQHNADVQQISVSNYARIILSQTLKAESKVTQGFGRINPPPHRDHVIERQMYADDMKTHVAPHTLWELRRGYSKDWVACVRAPKWTPTNEYRRKQL